MNKSYLYIDAISFKYKLDCVDIRFLEKSQGVKA